MELHWEFGKGPATTRELADLVEQEGRLIPSKYLDRAGERCLWGVIDSLFWGAEGTALRGRRLALADREFLHSPFICLSPASNDLFKGSPEERCAEMARRLRVIP